VRARKRFGQHFLEPAWVAKLVAAIDPRANETFLEIGPGRGALTKELAPRVGRLVAVEIDRDLAAALPPLVPGARAGRSSVISSRPISTPCSRTRPGRSASPVTSPTTWPRPSWPGCSDTSDGGQTLADATVMLQKEVAERVVAGPGSADYGPLAVAVALDADASSVMTLPPGAFRPTTQGHVGGRPAPLSAHPPWTSATERSSDAWSAAPFSSAGRRFSTRSRRRGHARARRLGSPCTRGS
jgi:16S rRNA (adenine1518-N6/adenine1519-N6)-dimethyltransferase